MKVGKTVTEVNGEQSEPRKLVAFRSESSQPCNRSYYHAECAPLRFAPLGAAPWLAPSYTSNSVGNPPYDAALHGEIRITAHKLPYFHVAVEGFNFVVKSNQTPDECRHLIGLYSQLPSILPHWGMLGEKLSSFPLYNSSTLNFWRCYEWKTMAFFLPTIPSEWGTLGIYGWYTHRLDPSQTILTFKLRTGNCTSLNLKIEH